LVLAGLVNGIPPISFLLGTNGSSSGFVLSRKLSPKKFQTVVVSPRSYFVFTPLLNSTAVGTLEFRTALEPVRSRYKPNVEFMHGRADDVDLNRKMLTVEESVVNQRHGHAMTEGLYHSDTATVANPERQGRRTEGKKWEVSYDKLVVSVGCYSQTFGTKGVKENAFFQKDIDDARRIRKRILECFELASLPTASEALRKQLLDFAIVGGGPTGMEFAAELSDLVREDMTKLYPNLAHKVQITVYDVMPRVLSMFDENLGKYAMQIFKRQGVRIRTSHHVQELRPGLPRRTGEEHLGAIVDTHGCYTLTTEEDGDIGIGICVWSTGNMMNPFVQRLMEKIRPFPSSSATILEEGIDDPTGKDQAWMIEKNPKTGAIVVDDHMRVQLQTESPEPEEGKQPARPTSRAYMQDVFALGDNANVRNSIMPATAQVASQQALWLGKHLNNETVATQKFAFKNLGVMTYLGNWKGLVQTGSGRGLEGYLAWLVWRGAYLTMSVSWRNKILIPTYWYVVDPQGCC